MELKYPDFDPKSTPEIGKGEGGGEGDMYLSSLNFFVLCLHASRSELLMAVVRL